MKKDVLTCKRLNEKVLFEDLKGGECFRSGGVLYIKILPQDLTWFKIENVNAVCILDAGLTFFDHNEEVFRTSKSFACVTETEVK